MSTTVAVDAEKWKTFRTRVEEFLPQIDCDNPQALFGDFDIDSLDFVELVMELEETFDVAIDESLIDDYTQLPLSWMYERCFPLETSDVG